MTYYLPTEYLSTGDAPLALWSGVDARMWSLLSLYRLSVVSNHFPLWKYVINILILPAC